MGDNGKARRPLISASKRVRTKRPAAVSEDQWRKRVRKALKFKLCKNSRLPNADLDNAVNGSLRVKIDYSRRLAETKSDPPPSKKREILKGRITALDQAAKTMRKELLPPDLPAAPMPGKPGQHYQRVGLSIEARIAWHDFLHDQSSLMKPAFEQHLIHVVGGPAAYGNLAENVEQTLRLLEALNRHYDFIFSTKDSDLAGVDDWMSPDKLKRFFIADLMIVFCKLRQEQIDKVPIGNAESTIVSDDGSTSNPNPLLYFLIAAVAPIAGSQFPAEDWMPPSNLRSIAERVRKGSWWC